MARRTPVLRWLDRYAGIPAVAMLGAVRRTRRRPRPAAPRSVAFLTTAAIGDTLLLSAVVQDARATWPGARIVMFAGTDNAAAARLIPGLDEVITLPVTRPWTAVRLIRATHADLLIDCGPWPRLNAVLAALSGAPYLVGFRTPGQARHFASDVAVRHRDDVHEIDNLRQLGAAAGIRIGSAPVIRTTTTLDPAILPAGRFAVCHMWSAGTGGWQKEWPQDRWRELVLLLVGRDLSVLLTGSAADAARCEAFVDFAGGPPRLRSVAGVVPLESLPRLLQQAAVVVSVNTSVMHMSAIVGTPTVSLEGPTPVHRWGPLGPRVASVESRLPGCGFLHLGFEYDGHRQDCMAGVDVADVVAAIDELLA